MGMIGYRDAVSQLNVSTNSLILSISLLLPYIYALMSGNTALMHAYGEQRDSS